MKNRNTKLVRMDSDSEKVLRNIMKERAFKDLADMKPKDIGIPEATRLMLRCPSWKNVENELRTLPKKGRIK